MRRGIAIIFLVLFLPTLAAAAPNGKLQLHYVSVGQGDAAVLITPQGQVVLFDSGVAGQCGALLGYLQTLGISGIDYHIASHYHSDHIGCTPQVLGLFPLRGLAYDRGGSYTTSTYTAYVSAVGAKRRTAVAGQSVALESGITLQFVAVNGNSTGPANGTSRTGCWFRMPEGTATR